MTVSIHAGENINEALARAGVLFDCGGNGTCGHCGIRVLKGFAAVTESDRAFFSEEELAEGWRLACRIEPGSVGDIEVEVPGLDVNKSVGCPDTYAEKSAENLTADDAAVSTRDFSIAIDIGTTTVAVAAVDMADGGVFDTFTCMNSQRMYGADVVSRIVASNNGLGPKLKGLVIEDINSGIEAIMTRNGLAVERLERIVIAGNTAMEHIFAGLSCEGLGIAPFEPVTLDAVQTSSGLLLPGISAFVGADVLAGMCAVEGFGGQESGKLTLFIDLGTNGEMALGNSGRILVASTAAGPAFEGGNISCGCAGINGAICDVALSDADDEEPIRFRLVGGAEEVFVASGDCEPAGICGSGVIALMAELLDEGIVDATGLIDERLNGKIRLAKKVLFTQKDIRELQLAKAAVMAGIETLMHEYGATCGDIGRVYLAGSFGRALNVAKAARIGLIPGELCDRCVAAGNTALQGTVDYIVNSSKTAETMARIKSVAQEIVLADNARFSEKFIENMNFNT